MESLRLKNVVFENFMSTKYACAVRFQKSLRLCGSHDSVKPYYSVKHQVYGYKTDISVLANKLCIGKRPHSIESVSDIEIFLKGLTWHQNTSKKRR